MLIDTHCHIHWSDYPIPIDAVIKKAHASDVMRVICVGTDVADSKRALECATRYEGLFATAGIHPHYAERDNPKELSDFALAVRKLVAIGEIGLDYYKSESSKESQIKLLEQMIDLAVKVDLPIIFHVRDAFDDFWPVLNNFPNHNIRGVLHCFTDTMKNAEEGLKRGFYFGVNGISTFTKDEAQKAMYAALPLDKIILETDAPFLTPEPFRGRIKVNEPAFVKQVAEHFSAIHQIPLEEIADKTTANARALFNL